MSNIHFQVSAVPEFMAVFFFLSWLFSASALMMGYVTYTVLKYYKFINEFDMDAYNVDSTKEHSINFQNCREENNIIILFSITIFQSIQKSCSVLKIKMHIDMCNPSLMPFFHVLFSGREISMLDGLDFDLIFFCFSFR